MMAAAQFGITVCSLTLGAVAEPTWPTCWSPPSAVPLPRALVHPAGLCDRAGRGGLLPPGVGEMVPKNLAMAAPERTALWLGPALVAFARLTRPVTVALGVVRQRSSCGSSGSSPRTRSAAVFTSEQLNQLVKDSRRAGLLGPDEQERLADALELGSRPLTDVLLGRTNWSRSAPRHPAPGGGTDSAHRLLPLPGPRRGRRLPRISARQGRARPGGDRPRGADSDCGGPWRRCAAELPLDDALTAMRAGASHLAAVAGASGRVLGLAALEDVLEMLVGEVHDPAHDRAGPGRRGPGRRGARGSPSPPWTAGCARTGAGRLQARRRLRASKRGRGPSGPRPDSTSPYACMRSGSRSVARSSRVGVPEQPDSRRSR